MRLALLLVLVVGLVGCAGFEQMTASRSDYVLYRETRVAESAELRLAAAARYLRDMPEGRFRGEVEGWFRAAEPKFFDLARDRPSLLRAYLRALPDGPHAPDARARLDEFEQLNSLRGQRAVASEQFLGRVQSELERAEAGRKELLVEFNQLGRLLATTKAFGAPTSELDHELLFRLRLTAPAGVCSESSCQKTYNVVYGVPDAGKIAAREAIFSLTVELERGLVQSIAVAGVGLWSQLGEAVDKRVVDALDLQARAEAIGRAVALLETAVEPALPSAECRVDVVAPVVLARRCRGVLLTMSAALVEGAEDRLEVRADRGESRAK